MARIISIDYPEAEGMAKAVIRRGELVVLPTDTVYGIGARIDEAAIARIFQAKRRPPERAVPVLVADLDAVGQVAAAFPEPAQKLAAAFWPGALTIVLPKRDDLPPNLTQLPTVGVRVPALAAAQKLLAAVGGALAVTSANYSEQPAACSILEAIAYFKDTVALYLEGGHCRGGVPSTVVDFTPEGELRVLREGPISADELRAVLV